MQCHGLCIIVDDTERRILLDIGKGAVIIRRSRKIWKVEHNLHYVCFGPCIRSYGTSRLPLDGFMLNFVVEHFSKISQEYSSFIQIGQD